MNNSTISWIEQLEKMIAQKHMLLSPFYQAWAQGKLPKENLKKYAKEYYHHVKAFPTYLSALHSACEDLETRKHLLQNLMDEESGQPNHIDLWKSFALSLGVEEENLESEDIEKPTQELISHFRESCSSYPLGIGVAALYCYESQIPSICQTKIEGLKKWYGLTDPQNYRYFSVHETADIEHSLAERKILAKIVNKKDEKAILKNTEKTLDKLLDFLNSFY